MDINVICISGRLGQKPELKTTQSGIEYTSFSVAVGRYTKKGEEQKTDWIPVKAWNSNAAFISNYANKGDMVVIDGRLEVSKSDDKTFYSVVAEHIRLISSSKKDAAPEEAVMEPVDTDDLPF